MYGEAVLNGTQCDDEDAKKYGNRFPDDLSGGAEDAAGLPRLHLVPAARVEKRLAQPIFAAAIASSETHCRRN